MVATQNIDTLGTIWTFSLRGVSLLWPAVYICIYSFSRCFYPKRLTIEEYNKRYIKKRQIDTGSTFNTNFLALFRANSSQTVRG